MLTNNINFYIWDVLFWGLTSLLTIFRSYRDFEAGENLWNPIGETHVLTLDPYSASQEPYKSNTTAPAIVLNLWNKNICYDY